MNPEVLLKLEFDKIKRQVQEYCTCSLGREKVENLFPSNDIQEVRCWQKETSEAQDILRRKPLLPLGGIWDIRAAIWKAEVGGILDSSELLQVCTTLVAGRRLRKSILELILENSLIGQVASKLKAFPEIEKRIEECLDQEGNVKDSASAELQRIRRQIYVLQGQIREKLDNILRNTQLQKYLQDSIVTIRGDRYVVPVKQEYRYQFPGVVHDLSASGATVFIEPMAVVQINNEIRRLKLLEREEIKRILQELTFLIKVEIIEIKETLEALAHLDFAFAKAKHSQKLRGIEPALNDQRWLEINRGRHPLLSEKAVPISVSLGKDFDALVVTGPNTGGKTVALKTIGLLTLMAQAGLHVPAEEGTCLGVFDKIFVDIGDEQSIEQSLSTFSSHMSNIVKMLEQVNSQSLVLLDELGAGTDPAEGTALAMAILEYLLDKGACTVATTHYGELKVFAYQHERVENASVEFDLETLQPTYRLLMGLPGKSNAFEIATRLGLDENIIDRARSYISTEELQVGDLIRNLEAARQKSEDELREAEELRLIQEKQEEELRNRQENWRKREIRLLEKAREEAMEIVRQARFEAEDLLKQLRRLEKESVNKEAIKQAQQIRDQLRNRYSELYESWTQVADTVSERIQTTLEGDSQNVTSRSKNTKAHKVKKWQFKAGDAVLIPRLNQQGYLLSAPTEEGEAQVQVGILKINVKESDLRPATHNHNRVDYSEVSNLMSSKMKEVAPEIHLRGMLVDDALTELEKYLDDVYLAGIPKVRIIHGKGTGTLRSVVQHYLSNHPHVKSYKLGGPQEGGMGVTVVELKN